MLRVHSSVATGHTRSRGASVETDSHDPLTTSTAPLSSSAFILKSALLPPDVKTEVKILNNNVAANLLIGHMFQVGVQ